MGFSYKYPRAAITVDAVVFAHSENGMEVLLIQRKFPPFQNAWAFPGGFVDMNETLEDAVKRELQEETGVKLDNLRQFKTFSAIDRDPRGRTISTVFISILDKKLFVKASDDAENAQWFSVKELPPLGFDHREILMEILEHFSKNCSKT